MLTLEQFRLKFARLQEVVYLDTAQRGLTPPELTEAGCQVLRDWEAFDSSNSRLRTEQAKERLATLLRVSSEELALVGNTAQGLNAVASAIPWQAGDNVVLADCEHASNFYPWAHLRERGVELRLVPCPTGILQPEDYRPYIDNRTQAVAASLVTFYPGAWLAVQQLADIAHAAGALLVLDAVQAVGILPVYPRELGADVLVAAAYKGLMSAHGAGFVYVKESVLSRLVPSHLYMFNIEGERGMVGNAFTSPDYTLLPTAVRLQMPQHAVGVAQMNQGLELILELGIEQIAEHVCSLASKLGQGLADLGYTVDTPLTPEYLRHIICVREPEASKLVEFLAENGVQASARRHGVRMAFHAYNNEADVERALAVLKAYKER